MMMKYFTNRVFNPMLIGNSWRSRNQKLLLGVLVLASSVLGANRAWCVRDGQVMKNATVLIEDTSESDTKWLYGLYAKVLRVKSDDCSQLYLEITGPGRAKSFLGKRMYVSRKYLFSKRWITRKDCHVNTGTEMIIDGLKSAVGQKLNGYHAKVLGRTHARNRAKEGRLYVEITSSDFDTKKLGDRIKSLRSDNLIPDPDVASDNTPMPYFHPGLSYAQCHGKFGHKVSIHGVSLQGKTYNNQEALIVGVNRYTNKVEVLAIPKTASPTKYLPSQFELVRDLLPSNLRHISDKPSVAYKKEIAKYRNNNDLIEAGTAADWGILF